MLRARAAIVGGGCSGTLVAAQLVALDPTSQVVVVEASGSFGPGVAYSTTDDLHLLNVPAARLSAWPDSPGHLVVWARMRDADVQPQTYLPRRVYGEYLASVMDEAVRRAASAGGRVQRVTGRVVGVEGRAGAEALLLEDGARIEADHVVLALGSPPSQSLAELPRDSRVFSSPWQPGALEGRDDGTVLLVGSGLTAVDAALSIGARSPDARIVAVSRSGQLPFAHLAAPLRSPAPPPPWPRADLLRADDLVATFCASIELAARDGYDWRDVVDGIRPQAQELWQRMGVQQQRTFLRHHARAWEIRRHRMAPQVAARLRELQQSGQFEVHAGRVAAAHAADDGIRVVIEPASVAASIEAGDRASACASSFFAQRIIGCTGPAADIAATGPALVRQLIVEQRAAADAHGLGVRASPGGRLLDAAGVPNARLHVLGPLRRGELWETTAVAEIRTQAARLARRIAERDA